EIDVSQVECALNFLGPEIAAASAGRSPTRAGPFAARPYPAGVFACAGEEEWLALSVRDAAEWGALCRVVPGLAGLEALDAEERAAAAPFCFAALAAYFAGRAAPAAVHALQALGIPAAKVARPEDLYHDPQLAFRRHFVERPHPSLGRFAYEMPSF